MRAAATLLAWAAMPAAAQNCADQWSDEFPHSVDGRINVLYTWNDGPDGQRLIAAGSFKSIEGVPCNNIAQFDGVRWSALGVGLSGTNLYDHMRAAISFDDDGDGVTELFVGGRFQMNGGIAHVVRWDGISWTSVGSLDQPSGVSVRALGVFDAGDGPRLYAGGANLLASGGVTTGLVEWDGMQWLAVENCVGAHIWCLLAGESPLTRQPLLYVGGWSDDQPGGFAGIAAWDGQSLAPVGGGIAGGSVRAMTMHQHDGINELIVGGDFTSAGGAAIRVLARWGGTSWLPLAGATYLQNIHERSYLHVFDDGRGSGPCVYSNFGITSINGGPGSDFARWNGQHWEAVGDDSLDREYLGRSPMTAATIDGESALWVGAAPIHVWDGTDWTMRNKAIVSSYQPSVHALCRFDDGTGAGEKMFVGGQFTIAGPLRVNNIVAWDGESWQHVGEGVPDPVQCMQVFDDGSGPMLYVGLKQPSNQANPALWRWDGRAWTTIGSPLREVYDMTIVTLEDGPHLVICGGTSSQGGVYRLDDGVWTQLGVHFNRRVYCLQVYDDGSGDALYAGGKFTATASQPVSLIARFDGGAWTPLGSELATTYEGSLVMTMAVYDDGSGPRLVLGGYFRNAQSVCITSWDGVEWSPVGFGVNYIVYALRVVPDPVTGINSLYIGGEFTWAGAGYMVASGIARWNSAYWESVGDLSGNYEGVYGGSSVRALETFVVDGEPRLIVGGSFDYAGGRPSQNIASFGACPSSIPPHEPCEYEVETPEISGLSYHGLHALNDRGTALLYAASTLYRWTPGQSTIAVPAPPNGYWVHDIPSPRISNDGAICATVTNATTRRGAIFLRNRWHIVPPLATGGWSEVYAINNHNAVLGVRTSHAGNPTVADEMFVWHAGVLTTLVNPTDHLLSPRLINDRGVVAGTHWIDGSNLPFILYNGRLTTLPALPGATSARPEAMNSSGVIVGSSILNGYRLPVRWSRGEISALPMFPEFE